MNILAIVIIAGMIIGIVLLSRRTGDEKSGRKEYLEALAKFLDVPLEQGEGTAGNGDVYRVKFKYEGRDVMFEDVEDRTFEKEIFREGFLKTRTSSQLTLNFTEKAHATIRTNIQNIKDLRHGWAQESRDIVLPKALKEFGVYTNNPLLVKRLVADDRIVNLMKSYKNRDSRGHAVMSLEVIGGEIVLKFHAPGMDLVPNLWDLQDNVTAIEKYLKAQGQLASKIDSLQKEAELSGR